MPTFISSPTTDINLPLDIIYKQLAGNLIGETIPIVTVPKYSTRSHVAAVLAANLQADTTSVVLRQPKPPNLSLLAQPPHEEPTTSTLPIRSASTKENLHPKPPPPAKKQFLKQKALEAKSSSLEPYVLLRGSSIDGALPTIQGSLLLTSFLDGDENGPYGKVDDVPMLFDTGCPITRVCEEMLSSEFRALLEKAEQEPYRQDGGVLTQVQGLFHFSNGPVELYGLGYVVPRSKMLNGFNGIILGQKALLDAMQYTITPKTILEARGQSVAPNTWGDIEIKAWFDQSEGTSDLIEI
ncbi:MAG: hypothetical protein Q9201_002020 [Fulgogasparrea decipioides]